MEPTEKAILLQLYQLPEQLKIEVLHYVAFLRGQHSQQQQVLRPHKRKFGSAQGKYTLSADFNAPLDDFKEYM